MTEATWALVVVTFLLAIGAGWYAAETRRIVTRMGQEREDRIRPLLAFALIPWGPNLLKLRITNVGPGPAFTISGRIEAVSGTESVAVRWSYPVLTPGKYEEFGIPAPPDANGTERFYMDIIRQRVDLVRADLTYNSASGRRYTLTEVIDLKDVTDDWISSRMMATEDHPERLLPRVAKALDNIEKHLKDIRSG